MRGDEGKKVCGLGATSPTGDCADIAEANGVPKTARDIVTVAIKR